MTMQNPTTETSVTISLAELATLEEQRVKREQAERARTRAERAREAREAEAKRRAEAAAETAAAEDARARQARDEAIEKVRLEARQHAATEVARIEAEAKARLELDKAGRAHELAVLRVRRETGRRRREYVLGAALALLACVSGVGTYDATQRLTGLERAGEELRDRERALAGERDDAKRTELAALDRRHAALLARSPARGADEARKTAEASRRTIGERAPGHDRLNAFGDSLDAFEARIEAIEKLETLDRQRADLAGWAASMRRKDVDTVERAAARAKAPGASADAIVAYARALDDLREKLAPRGGISRRLPAGGTPPSRGTCHPDDPGCGLDGKPLF